MTETDSFGAEAAPPVESADPPDAAPPFEPDYSLIGYEKKDGNPSDIEQR